MGGPGREEGPRGHYGSLHRHEQEGDPQQARHVKARSWLSSGQDFGAWSAATQFGSTRPHGPPTSGLGRPRFAEDEARCLFCISCVRGAQPSKQGTHFKKVARISLISIGVRAMRGRSVCILTLEASVLKIVYRQD